MKTTFIKLPIVVTALGLFALSGTADAQTTTTKRSVTTTTGSFTEFVPDSRMVVVRTEADATPVRYAVTEKTMIVDHAGNPITVEKIPAGAPLSVHYDEVDDRMVASRIVVQQAPAGGTTVRDSVTTTTRTRPVTEDEVEAREEVAEEKAEAREEIREEVKDEMD